MKVTKFLKRWAIKILSIFSSTETYWERRYSNSNSTGSGSLGENLKYKIEIINYFINKTGAKNIIDLGCGNAEYVKYLNFERYIGADISESVIKRNINSHSQLNNVEFSLLSDLKTDRGKFDLVISSEIIFCLKKNEIINHLKDLDRFALDNILILSYIKPNNFHLPFSPNWPWNALQNWQLKSAVFAPKGISHALDVKLFSSAEKSDFSK